MACYVIALMITTDLSLNGKAPFPLTSLTLLVNGPSKTYSVQLGQHLLSSHVTLGVTQWNLGVPEKNTIPMSCKEEGIITSKQVAT